MNCDTIQQRIHVFDELTDVEQRQVLEHVDGCGSCRELLEAVRQMNEQVRNTASVDLTPPHASRLTRRIMESIHAPEQGPGIFSRMVSVLEERWTIWTLSGVSTVLVLFLAIELPQPGLTVTRPDVALSQGVVLDRHVFEEQRLKHRETPMYKSISTCHSPFRSAKTTADCLRQKFSAQSI